LKTPDPAAPEETTESRREDSDHQAIQRAEDDGMIVHHSPTSSADYGGDRNAIAQR